VSEALGRDWGMIDAVDVCFGLDGDNDTFRTLTLVSTFVFIVGIFTSIDAGYVCFVLGRHNDAFRTLTFASALTVFVVYLHL
jgi:hypothetical protein